MARFEDFVPDLSHLTGRTTAVRNAWIQETISRDLPKVRMTFTPEYNPFLKAFGIAKTGAGSQIGKRAFVSQRELIDTIVHEELHHRWWSRNIYGHHGPKLNARFENVVKRYMRMRGF